MPPASEEEASSQIATIGYWTHNKNDKTRHPFKPQEIIVYLGDKSTWNVSSLEDYISLFPSLPCFSAALRK